MNSFISWIGGKKLLKRKIIEQFPKNFDRYIEVFGGAGWVLFDKEKHADMEVYNDMNGELVNLFRCVKYHPDALQKELDWMLISREQFFNCVAQNEIQGMTDIQRAARFYCRIKLSFGADLDSFGVRSRDMQGTIEYLQKASKRLNRVVIENVDFERLIKTYDRESALFYCDGSNSVSLQVTDNDGNVSDAATVSFVISTSAPTLNVTSPQDNLLTNSNRVTVAGTAAAGSDAVTLTSVKINGETVSVGSGGAFSKEITLKEGANTITVVAEDSIGKTTSVTRHVTVDTKAPVISDVEAETTTVDANGTIHLTFKVTDPAD